VLVQRVTVLYCYHKYKCQS